MRASKIVFLVVWMVIGISFSAYAQNLVKIKQADRYKGGKIGETQYQAFVGDVVFQQKQTIVYCDSAIIFGKNDIVEAFGGVRILQGDSTTIVSQRAVYNGNTRIAQLRDDVVFTKLNSMTLYTDNLDYDINKEMASYFDGGRLVDSANVLTSVRGTYDDKTKMATFLEDVVATFPGYKLESEALRYNTFTEIVYFISPTKLIREDGTVVNYEGGEYDTKNKTSLLTKGQIESQEYYIEAERYRINDAQRTYRAIGKVVMQSKDDDIIISGNEAFMNDLTQVSKVYGSPLMKKPLEGDTLYLSADTLVSIDSEVETNKRLLAYGDVKIYKSNLQGRADSLAYYPSDSLLQFYRDPVLWSSGNQMTADTITVFIANGTIDRMEMDANSFVVSVDTLKNFNQVKGRNMVSYFKDGNLSKVDVDGNCESIFFALDENEEYVVGMNKIICSNMFIFFQNNAATKVSALYKPDASFIPPHELTPEQKRLPGFDWLDKIRPSLSDVLNHESSSASKPVDETKLPEPVKPELQEGLPLPNKNR